MRKMKRKKAVFRTFLGPQAVAEARARADKRRTERLTARQTRISSRQDNRTKRTELRRAPALAKMQGKAASGYWSPEAVKSRQVTLGGALEKGIGAASAIAQSLIKGDDPEAELDDGGGDVDEGGGGLTSDEGPPWMLIGGGVAVVVVIIIIIVMMSGGKKKGA